MWDGRGIPHPYDESEFHLAFSVYKEGLAPLSCSLAINSVLSLAPALSLVL
jgi:hypothetical protein